MNMNTASRGISFVPIIIAVALVAIAGGAFFALTSMPSLDDVGKNADEENRAASDEAMKNTAVAEGMEHEPSTKPMAVSPGQFSGTVIARGASTLLEFNESDFEQALNSEKLIALYFYANWCPICRAEFPDTKSAFMEFPNDSVVGFRVHFNDDETTERDRELAREHSVAYQHTKVFLRGGERVLKSPEVWNTTRYLETFRQLTTNN